MARNHDKKTFANEYCLCRDIPHRWGNNGQLIIGDNTVGKNVIFTIYNFPYTEIVQVIDSMCEYDNGGWFCGLKSRTDVLCLS